MSAEKIRRYYHFFGWVQGVGFRRRAANAARRLDVSGWVRNSSDGSVEMEAEGSRAALSALLDELENGWFIRIERTDVRELPPLNERDFRVLD